MNIYSYIRIYEHILSTRQFYKLLYKRFLHLWIKVWTKNSITYTYNQTVTNQLFLRLKQHVNKNFP